MSALLISKSWIIAVLIAAVMILPSFAYCMSSWNSLSTIYIQLRQQQSLLEIRDRQRSRKQENLDIIEQNSRSKLVAMEDVAAAMTNLSLQMNAAGLTETDFKMERREIWRETDGVSSVNRVMIEGVGDYADAIAYIDELLNGNTYYFIENISLSREDLQIRLRAVCVIAGYSGSPFSDLSEIPSDYLYLNPFEERKK